MDRLGENAPIKDDRLSVVTTYVFSPGRITRTDVVTPKGRVELKGAALEFAAYADGIQRADGRFAYADGPVRSFETSGLGDCRIDAVKGDHDYETPTGPFQSRVACTNDPRLSGGVITLSWTLTYR